MSSYVTSGFGPSPKLMVGGQPVFLFGGLNDRVSPTTVQITNVSLTSNVATISGYVTSGVAPSVGGLVSIQGTVTASGSFNVSAATITGATFSATTGIGTFTFALTHADVASTADAGKALVPTAVTYEALANGSSAPAASAENDPSTNDERSYFAQVFFGSLPTAATVTLQAALVDNDADYATVGTVATVSAGAVTLSSAQFANGNYRFVRFNVSGVTGGTSPTFAAALLG
jgi:hypothetical protein